MWDHLDLWAHENACGHGSDPRQPLASGAYGEVWIRETPLSDAGERLARILLSHFGREDFDLKRFHEYCCGYPHEFRPAHTPGRKSSTTATPRWRGNWWRTGRCATCGATTRRCSGSKRRTSSWGRAGSFSA